MSGVLEAMNRENISRHVIIISCTQRWLIALVIADSRWVTFKIARQMDFCIFMDNLMPSQYCKEPES